MSPPGVLCRVWVGGIRGTCPHIVYTVLHSREGHVNVVRFLVNEAHCDPHVKDNDGWTPLDDACR